MSDKGKNKALTRRQRMTPEQKEREAWTTKERRRLRSPDHKPASGGKSVAPKLTEASAETVINGIRLGDHLGLVYMWVNRQAKRCGSFRSNKSDARFRMDGDELVGQAWIALGNAARTFVPSKGYTFSTHASAALRWQLSNEVDRMRGATRRGHGPCKDGPVLLGPEAMATLRSERGEHGSVLDQLCMEEDQDRERRFAEEILSQMPARGADIIRKRVNGLTLLQAGSADGLSRERVRQIAGRMLKPDIDAESERVKAGWRTRRAQQRKAKQQTAA